MSKPYIICVDDERIVLDSLKVELKFKFSTDFDIEVAESSQEALQLFEELKSEQAEIPLIISDYIMPQMKGDQLLKQICEQNPQIVAIFLTGQATLQGVTNAVNQAGIFRFIEKPWSKEILYSTVSEALHYYYQEKSHEIKNQHFRETNQKLRRPSPKKPKNCP